MFSLSRRIYFNTLLTDMYTVFILTVEEFGIENTYKEFCLSPFSSHLRCFPHLAVLLLTGWYIQFNSNESSTIIRKISKCHHKQTAPHFVCEHITLPYLMQSGVATRAITSHAPTMFNDKVISILMCISHPKVGTLYIAIQGSRL